jgi:hypothetical protein
MQCNVEFGYQLSIRYGTKENHGKPWSSCPVTGPSGCKLTTSQQSGVQYASPNIVSLSVRLLYCRIRLQFVLQIYCILASCYIRLTRNICSFVHQCNTFTSYILLIVDMFRSHTAIFKCYSILSRSCCSVMPIFAYVVLPAMCFGWRCAYCQCPFVRIFVLPLRPPCCLFTLCGRHVACCLKMAVWGRNMSTINRI